MRSLFVIVLLTSSLLSKAAFVKDSSFISYQEFTKLSKKEVKERFYKDDDSRRMIDVYYKHKSKGVGLLLWIIPLAIIGIYFAVLGSRSTNGMGGVVGLVLAITFLLPATILGVRLLGTLLFNGKAYSKRFFYNELKEYFESHYNK